jgi:hypothetical protein
MDANGTRTGSEGAAEAADRGRRRRRDSGEENVRYFMPKSGSSAERPELGQEMAGEGEALVQAFRSGQVFYTVAAWRATTEIDGSEAKIVKQAAVRT